MVRYHMTSCRGQPYTVRTINFGFSHCPSASSISFAGGKKSNKDTGHTLQIWFIQNRILKCVQYILISQNMRGPTISMSENIQRLNSLLVKDKRGIIICHVFVLYEHNRANLSGCSNSLKKLSFVRGFVYNHPKF